MNFKDQAALNAAWKAALQKDQTLFNFDEFEAGFEAALAHRDAQAQQVNQQMLEALKAVQNRLRPGTQLREKIDAAIAAAEAKGGV